MMLQIVSLSMPFGLLFFHAEVYSPLIHMCTLLSHTFSSQCRPIPAILRAVTRLSLIVSCLFVVVVS